MRSLLFGAVMLVGCSTDEAPGMLTLSPDSTQLAVGGSTFVQAFLVTTTESQNTNPIAATWSAAPDGLITLTATNNIQKVTGVGVGNVVVTAKADGQTAMVGFTITAM